MVELCIPFEESLSLDENTDEFGHRGEEKKPRAKPIEQKNVPAGCRSISADQTQSHFWLLVLISFLALKNLRKRRWAGEKP